MTLPVTREWIMTASGVAFFPFAPRPEDIRIHDIAHHLSNCCRFTGAVRTFYSVAQHSVLISDLLRGCPEFTSAAGAIRAGLYGLLHDAAEAYLVDLPRPIKRSPDLQAYRTAEASLQRAIYTRFGLDPGAEPALVKLFDRRLLRTEQRDLMPPPTLDEDRTDVPPFDEITVADPWSPARARDEFLDRFQRATCLLELF